MSLIEPTCQDCGAVQGSNATNCRACAYTADALGSIKVNIPANYVRSDKTAEWWLARIRNKITSRG